MDRRTFNKTMAGGAMWLASPVREGGDGGGASRCGLRKRQEQPDPNGRTRCTAVYW